MCADGNMLLLLVPLNNKKMDSDVPYILKVVPVIEITASDDNINFTVYVIMQHGTLPSEATLKLVKQIDPPSAFVSSQLQPTGFYSLQYNIKAKQMTILKKYDYICAHNDSCRGSVYKSFRSSQ